MQEKTIITCAIAGNLTQREQHPRLPITPHEIAVAALDAAAAGAAVLHLHARDSVTGRGSMEFSLYEEITSRIREKNTEVILNLTTGEGGRFVPSEGNPAIAGPGTTLCAPELRVSHIERLRPELCTLDLNTMWSGTAAVINAPQNVEFMAERIYAAGVVPEVEVFDSGDLHLASHLQKTGVLKDRLLIQIVLGVRYGAVANAETLLYLKSQLPKACTWGAFGLGRHSFPMVAQSWLLGGHVRVGMEDNVYIRKGELCRDNAQLVEKATGIVRSLGGEVASAREARAILGVQAAPELTCRVVS